MAEHHSTASNESLPGRVRLLAERTLPAASAPPTPTPQPPAGSVQNGATPAFLAQMAAILAAMAAVVQARFLLLLAVMGAFVLAYRSQMNPDQMMIATTVIYNLTVVGPLVYLYARKA